MQLLKSMNTFRHNTSETNGGFTLIELIMVIILLSVIGMLGGNFIAQSFRGFYQSDNRIDIYEEGKMALVRMEREIHNAIPNAFNEIPPFPKDDLQFGMIDEKAMRIVFGQYIDNNPNDFIRDRMSVLNIGTIISVNNLSWSHFTAAGTPRLYEVTDNTHPSGVRMDLEGGGRNLQDPLKDGRFYAVNQMVRYCLSGTTLRRNTVDIDNTNYESGLSFPGPCTGQPLATNVFIPPPAIAIFNYHPGTATNSPLVTIDFRIAPPNGESINFHKEIMILNVP